MTDKEIIEANNESLNECIELVKDLSVNTDYKVKLFETEDDLNADENAQSGDLAVVYGGTYENAKANENFQYIIFPEVVVLPEAVTSTITFGKKTKYEDPFGVMSKDLIYCSGTLTNETFSISLDTSPTPYFGSYDPEESDDENISTAIASATYTSVDGITYIKNSMRSKAILKSELSYEYYTDETPAIDYVGYFVQVKTNTFIGFYKYNTEYELISGPAEDNTELLEEQTNLISDLKTELESKA
jgi:hypothetical protein